MCVLWQYSRRVFLNETALGLLCLCAVRQDLRCVQDVASHDEFLRLAQHALLIPAVRVSRGNEKASEQAGADDGNGAYVNGSEFALHLPIGRTVL